MNISVRHLRAFLAVAEVKNFTKAAAMLNLSQPSLSATIQQLEEMLGAALFERHSRQVLLTGVGDIYLGVAERLLSEMEASVDVVRSHVEKREGHLRIAALPSLAAGYLAVELQRFRKAYPNIRLSLHDDFNQTLLKLVRRGEVDLGFVHLQEPSSDLDSVLLFEEPYVLICAQDHPLATRNSINWSVLKDYPFINVSKGSSTQDAVIQAFASNGLVLKNTIETNYVSTAIGLVAEGLGITAMPAPAFRNLAGRTDLVTRKLKAPSISQRIQLVVRKKRWLSPAAEAFRDQVLGNKIWKTSPITR